MARRPARLERAGALTPRDRIWAAIRAFKHTHATSALFSPAELSVFAGQHLDTVRSYVQGLTAAGYLQLAERKRPEAAPRREFAQYRLVRDVGADAPRVTPEGQPVTAGQGRERMWTVMRSMRDFNATELAGLASIEGCAVSEEEAINYAYHLRKAGYLAVIVPAKPGTKARYRFVKSRNTGPRAPIVGRDKSVMDANTGEVAWQRP